MNLTEKEIIHKSDERFNLIKELCHLSKNLYNASLYDVRQHFFKTKEYRTWQSQAPLFVKDKNPDFYALPSGLAQEVLMQVGRQFIDFFNNKSTRNKRIPRYKDTGGYNIVTFPKAVISKASFFDKDELPIYGQTDNPTFSGRRVEQGLYQDSKGNLWNADLNGAANIMRKVVSEKAYRRIRRTKELMKQPILVTL